MGCLAPVSESAPVQDRHTPRPGEDLISRYRTQLGCAAGLANPTDSELAKAIKRLGGGYVQHGFRQLVQNIRLDHERLFFELAALARWED